MSTTTDHRVETIPVATDSVADAMESDDFKRIFRHHAAGVAVVTADSAGGPVAMTVTSVFSISAEPPLFVFSASALSSSTPALLEADTLVVHLLHEDQLWLGRLAATSGADRFPDGEWHRLATGEPIYSSARTWVRGRVVTRLSAGSSTVFVVQAIEGDSSASDTETPLVYHNRTWHALDERSRRD